MRKTAFVSLMAAVIMCLPCFAAVIAPGIAEVCVGESTADLYIQGVASNGQDISCLIGRETAEVLEFSNLETQEIPAKTLFLIDMSTSMQPQDQQMILELLTVLIDGKSAKDEFAIVTFGEGLQTVCDFMEDRYELSRSVGKLAFQQQATNLYSAVKQIVDGFNSDTQEEPAYRQIVVITDGVEKSSDGILRDEMNGQLKQTPYPVLTIGCKHADNAESLKELFALSRITNAPGFTLEQGADLAVMAREIQTFSQGISRARVALPEILMDGSVQRIEIAVGVTKLGCDIRMPQRQSASEAPPSSQEPPPVSVPQSAVEQPAEPRKSFPILWLIAAAGVIAIIATVALIRNSRKPKKDEPASGGSRPEERQRTDTETDIGKTQIDRDTEQIVQNRSSISVTLIDESNSARRFEFPVDPPAVIGRDPSECSLVIEYDKSISRRHCKLFVENGNLYVQDLGSANKTFVNEQIVGEKSGLKQGDTLRLGKARFKVDV